MTSNDFPFGGAYVASTRDERGTFTGAVSTESVGTFTGVPVSGRLGRFVDTQARRGGTVTASNHTVTGSFRTATGSLRTA